MSKAVELDEWPYSWNIYHTLSGLNHLGFVQSLANILLTENSPLLVFPLNDNLFEADSADMSQRREQGCVVIEAIDVKLHRTLLGNNWVSSRPTVYRQLQIASNTSNDKWANLCSSICQHFTWTPFAWQQFIFGTGRPTGRGPGQTVMGWMFY